MIKSYVVDMNDTEQALEIEIGYYVLFSPDLRCVDWTNTPDFRGHKIRTTQKVIAAKKDGELVGICVVSNDYVYYPVMKGDYKEVLTALILAAYKANGNYLKAYTTNELILSTAVEMGIGVTRDGNTLEFK